MKILKKYALYAIAFLGSISPAVIGVSIGLNFDNNRSKAEAKMAGILESEGYNEFNEQYKAENFASLDAALNSGSISYEAYVAATENLADYDEEKYIAEYASADAQAEYVAAQESFDKNNHSAIALGFGMVGAIFTVPIGVGAIYTIHDVFDEQKNTEQAPKGKSLS